MAIDTEGMKERAGEIIDRTAEVVDELSAKAKPYVDRAAAIIEPTAEKVRPRVQEAVEAAKPHVEMARAKAGELYEQAQPYVDQAWVAAGDMAQKAKPHAERALDWAANMVDKAFDILEDQTGADLDGDGVVGAAVREALEIEVIDGEPSDAAADEGVEPEVELPETPAEAATPAPAPETIGEEVE